MKYYSFSVYQSRYATSIVAKYLDTVKIKIGKMFYKTNFPSDMIFIKDYVSTSDGKVKKLTREPNIYYIACIRSLIYSLSTRVYLSFLVHKIAKILSNHGK